ncbi:MAG TPA: hypothetical protein VNJ01_10760 [Bacteriovoracaceae bacterium]|nr:hypothetical protein [Bacteriovoracaceae bacterium]
MTKLIALLTLAFTANFAFAQVPTLALTFETNLKVINASSAQMAKIQAAEEHIKGVIASEAFRTKVINHSYGGRQTYVDNGGYNNQTIYNKILDGAEELSSTKNNTMDLEVELYYENSSTVGYTYANTRRIYVNTKFFNYYTAKEVAGNLMHEWLHKVGFEHDFNYSTSRDYSVPYAIGYMMETLNGEATLPLSAPGSLTLASTASNISLKWTASRSSAGIKEYKVYRKLAGATSTYLQGTTTGLTFSQAAPTKSATYYVKAVDNDDETAKSAEVQFLKAVAVSAPANVTITKGTSSLTVKWSASQSSAGIKEYKVYRRLSGATSVYLQGTTTGLSLTQTKPSSNAIYYVKAVDYNGVTAKSAEVNFTR